MNNQLISICIPTYNGEKYLKKCLDAVLSQSYKNFEVLVVDDQSTDGTVGIIHEYLKKDERIRFYQNEINLGLVGNWNKCVDLSSGEWIKFVFQDDFMEPGCLMSFIEHSDAHTQLIVSKRSFVLSESLTAEYVKYYTSIVRTLENTGALSDGNTVSAQTICRVAAENIALNFIGEPSLTMFRKSLLKKHGSFNAGLEQICDLEFLLRVASNHGLQYIPEKLCHFSIHAESTTSSNLTKKRFILSHLDPIILVRQMLYDQEYASLRNSLSPALLFKLRHFLKIRSFEARLQSNKNENNKKAFEQAVSKFPEIGKLSKGNLLTRLTYLLILLRRESRKIKE